MLDLHRLRVLFELQRLGTVTAVAEALQYTHSAISQQLAQCERDVGVKLYEKVGRRIRLTEQGEILAEYAGRMLALSDEAESRVLASTSLVRGTIRVTSFQTVMSSIIPAALTVLARTHPDLQVEIKQRDVETASELLRTREVDLILGEEYDADIPATDEYTHRELLAEDPLHLITPQEGPWSELTFPELEGVPFAINPAHLSMGRFTHQMCLRHGFSPNVVFETPDPFLQGHLVRTGHAVAIVPRLFLPNLGNVRVLDLPGNSTRTLYTAVRSGRESHPGLAAFRVALATATQHALARAPEPEV